MEAIRKFTVSRNDAMHEGWPDIVRTRSGRLLCVFSECEAHACGDSSQKERGKEIGCINDYMKILQNDGRLFSQKKLKIFFKNILTDLLGICIITSVVSVS